MEPLDASKTSVTHREAVPPRSRVCSFEGAFVAGKRPGFEEERSGISEMEIERLPVKGPLLF